MTDAATLAPVGHNNPPADPYEAMTTHIDDLYIEASNWADGAKIETEAQAAVVERLIDDFKQAIEDCEAARDVEKKPHADEVKRIQERWYPLIGDTQRVTGKAIRAKKALLAVKSVWGREQDALRAAEARRLRDEAAAQAAEAAKAARNAVGDLAATEEAEDLIRAAQTTLRAATQAEKPAVKGMRDNWVICGFQDVPAADGKVTQGRVALLRHYFTMNPDALVEACLKLAEADVRAGKRTIPGLVIENQRRAV